MQTSTNRGLITGCLILAILLFAQAVPCEADFSTAVDAYNSGDYETAFREFRRLADRGDADAQGILGLMYRKGQGVPQDYKQALYWYRKAADHRYA